MKASELLTEALEYVRRFRGQVFVVKLGGETMLDKDVLLSVAKDLMFLNLVGIKVVLVHGGGVEITEAMEKFGKKPTFVKGLRVTDRETMDIVEMVLTGKVNTELVSLINTQEGNAVGISGQSGSLFQASKVDSEIDLGYVGEVKKVNPKIVKTQLDNDYIPVISPIGLGPGGMTYNINADTAAAKLAVALNASKLILLTNVEGVLDKKNNLVKRLTLLETKKLIKQDFIKGGMIPKLEACIHALENGVDRTHIVKASRHAVLEEILTATGTGTMITKRKVKDE
ncbi:MAG: acetylglutamate kinase [Candidatus Altiarchaeota archaeon]